MSCDLGLFYVCEFQCHGFRPFVTNLLFFAASVSYMKPHFRMHFSYIIAKNIRFSLS